MNMKINMERWDSFLNNFRYYTESMSGEYFEDMDSLSQNEFFSIQEGYKNNLLKAVSIFHDCLPWDESIIGMGKISDEVIKIVFKGSNLVDYREKSRFKDKIDENKKEAERLLYNIYCGKNDAQAFDDAVKFWGGKYDLLGYLFFIKDPNKYLPIRSTLFDAKFEYLGIPLRTAGKCSSKNYFAYIKCIDELRSMIEEYYKFKVTLLEAHSVLWQLESVNEFIAKITEESYADALFAREVADLEDKEDTDEFEYSGTRKEKASPTYVNGRRIYPRDRHVSLNALRHARYCCEIDSAHESFIRRNSKHKYMEPHHLIPLSRSDDFEYSLDVEENIVSLCSNCHNEIHYGEEAMDLVKFLYDQRKDDLKRAGIDITLDELLAMYK